MSRKDRQRDNLKRLAIGSTIAATAGYLAGVLTAPKSGKKTREDIKSTTDRGLGEAEKELKKLHTELDKLIKDTKTNGSKLSAKAQKEAGDWLARAKDTKEKTREVLSALHEGDADDKELKKAVKDAKDAVSHLKEYFKK